MVDIEFVMNVINSVSSPLAGIFAAVLAYRISRREYHEKIKGILVKVFFPIAIGFVLYGIAQVSYTIMVQVGYDYPALHITDFIWMIGYILVFYGFTYFSIKMYKEREKIGQGLTYIISSLLIVGGIIGYLIGKYILGFQTGESLLQIFFDYFYPVASGLIFVASISAYLFFREVPVIKTPLLLLAITNTIYLVGDIFYTYYAWNEIYRIPGIISTGSYIVGDIIAITAFYLLFSLLGAKKGKEQ